MRLTPDEQQQIKSIIAAHFGADAEIWLFGSRVDDQKRGGDVDLYVTPAQHSDDYMRRVNCLGALERALPYPVDLVLADPDKRRAIDHIALQTGIAL